MKDFINICGIKPDAEENFNLKITTLDMKGKTIFPFAFVKLNLVKREQTCLAQNIRYTLVFWTKLSIPKAILFRLGKS